MSTKKPSTFVKDGYLYRRKQGGGKVLRIRKADASSVGIDKVVNDPERLAKWRSNPGLRSKLPDKALPAAMRKTREVNRKLDSPVVPGSSLTNRELSHQTRDYLKVKYGAADLADQQGIASQKTLNTDQGGWYDEYIKSLRQHSENVGKINDQAVQQVQGYGAGVQTANAQTLAGQGDPLSQGVNRQAAAVRDARSGSWVGQLTSQGQGQKTYADTLANVVGPGQKLQARAQGARKLAALGEQVKQRADAKGADAANFKAGLVANEVKGLQAMAIASGKALTSVKTAKIRAAATTTAAAGKLNKYGYTSTEWAKLSESEKASIRKSASSGGSGSTTKLAPDKVHTMDQWLKATPQQRKKWLRDAKGGTGGAEKEIQTRFGSAYSRLSNTRVPAPTSSNPKRTVPLTPAYVRKNADQIVNVMIANDPKMTRKLARRVISAWIKNRGKDPGSFKDYGKPGAPAVP